MNEDIFQTFGDHVLQFARTVDIVPPDIYSGVMATIEKYLRVSWNASFFSITVQRPVDSGPGLWGEWPEGEEDWWYRSIKKDDEYTCQTALAFDIRKPLWIVPRGSRKTLDNAVEYEDLFKNVEPQQIPKYANTKNTTDANRSSNIPSRTSIILPLSDKIGEDRYFGVMNLESKDYLERSSYLQDELNALADGISILRHLKRTYELQVRNTKEAKKCLDSASSLAPARKVFIGHGRSKLWLDLRDFIKNSLGLEWDEFNRVPTPGTTNRDRLRQMLDQAAIAFLIMTGEDEQADAKLNPRLNVVHEAGLFQSRLGFQRAIVLLEEGCQDFSNIDGLQPIRFPKGNIKASFDELRRVLEREGLLSLKATKRRVRPTRPRAAARESADPAVELHAVGDADL